MNLDAELLIGLSEEELEAFADGKLAPAAQLHLDELLKRNAESRLSEGEQSELDRLLSQVDHLTSLKARARDTLLQQSGAPRK